jgi:hypothetical protein
MEIEMGMTMEISMEMGMTMKMELESEELNSEP